MIDDEYGLENNSLRRRFVRWFSRKPAFETIGDSGNDGLPIKQWVGRRGRGLVDMTGLVIGRNVSCRLFLKALKRIDAQLASRDSNADMEENLWRLCEPLYELQTLEAAVFAKEHYMPLMAKILEKYLAAVREGRLVPAEPETGDDCPLDMNLVNLLVRYESPPGLRQVARLVREGHRTSENWWLSVFSPEQPYVSETGLRLMLLLGDFVPENLLGLAYLELCNLAMRYRKFLRERREPLVGAEELEFPYASPAGLEKLREYLTETATDIPAEYFYHAAELAAGAIAHVAEADRLPLARLAIQSKDDPIALAGTIQAAKQGDASGLEKLAERAADWRYAVSAVDGLRECGRDDLIPAAAGDPLFAAKSRAALLVQDEGWTFPDEIEQVDARDLVWPPVKKRMSAFVLRMVYHAEKAGDEETVEHSLVLNDAAAIFPSGVFDREPSVAEIYALHCAFEMNRDHWQNPAVGLALLKRHNPDMTF